METQCNKATWHINPLNPDLLVFELLPDESIGQTVAEKCFSCTVILLTRACWFRVFRIWVVIRG